MTMMKRRNIIMVMMTSLLLGSCSSEDILSVPNGNGRIRFDVGVSQSQEVMEMPISTSPMTCGNDTLYAHSAALRNIELHNDVTSKTRGTEIVNSSFYDYFGLYGYIYNSDQTWGNNGSELQPTINNEKIAKGDTWTSSTYLPGQTKMMALFAYAPYINSGIPVNAEISVTGNQGAPQLTYTIDSDVSKQVDLLVAKNVDVVGNTSSVELDFKHALTAVKFAIGGTITGFTKITKIKISGVKNSGTLSLDGGNWNLNESTASYTIEKEIDLSTPGDITGSSPDDDLLLLMPQTLPSGAKLEVTMTNDIGTKTFSTDLTGGEWKKGYTVTYQLSVDRVAGEFHFEVTPSTTSIPKEGGDIELKVKSYYQIADGGAQVPIPWSGTYNMGSNQYTLSGDGSVNDDIRKISVPENSALTHTETLKANQSKGTAQKPWNLSNSRGEAEVENTANCYVVNSKGIYSIPLVYGCSIKNSNTNSLAYGVGTYNSTTLNTSTFKTHKDDRISDPYIYNNPESEPKYAPSEAELIWQDWQGLISSVKYNSNTQMIEFEIGDGIHQGNAIIAIKDANNVVLWSWHIWVTDRDISATVPIKCNDETSNIYKFMQVPLGWCDPSSGASPRQITVSLTQDNSAKLATAVVNQAGAAATSGNAPYYQWGRKDPLCASVGTANTTTFKTLYDISNSTVSYSAIDYGSVGNSIKNPGAFINGSSSTYDWNSPTCYDTWNAVRGNTAPSSDTDRYNHNKVVKSVYDPCPYGFKMPETMAFTGFTSNGANKTSNNYNNGLWDTNGWKFYTNGYNEGETDFWIAGGYRSWNSGSLDYVGSGGPYWSAGPGSYTSGCRLSFDSRNVTPQNYSLRAYGFSVRPVSE